MDAGSLEELTNEAKQLSAIFVSSLNTAKGKSKKQS
jgi:hypothetical protein